MTAEKQLICCFLSFPKAAFYCKLRLSKDNFLVFTQPPTEKLRPKRPFFRLKTTSKIAFSLSKLKQWSSTSYLKTKYLRPHFFSSSKLHSISVDLGQLFGHLDLYSSNPPYFSSLLTMALSIPFHFLPFLGHCQVVF